MPVDQTQRDEKNNLIVVTLFESYLSRFVLENSRFYRDIYCKLFDGICYYLQASPDENQEFQAFFKDKPVGFDLSRYMYTVFSRVNSIYPGHDSFEALKSNFNLQPSDYFIKLMADELLNTTFKHPLKVLFNSPIKTPLDRVRATASISSGSNGFFSPVLPGHRSPYNPFRSFQLFDESNRGVIPISEGCEDEESEVLSTRDIGIVEMQFISAELSNYFEDPVCGARFLYQPNESSFVANWLRDRHLPVIAGSSGSTEMLFTRVLPLVKLTTEEIQMLVFAQACSMLANGHHSLFEALLVADHFGHKLSNKDTLLEFYLQCVPELIRFDPLFLEFLDSDTIKPLLLDIPLFDNGRVSLLLTPGSINSPSPFV